MVRQVNSQRGHMAELTMAHTNTIVTLDVPILVNVNIIQQMESQRKRAWALLTHDWGDKLRTGRCLGGYGTWPMQKAIPQGVYCRVPALGGYGSDICFRVARDACGGQKGLTLNQ